MSHTPNSVASGGQASFLNYSYCPSLPSPSYRKLDREQLLDVRGQSFLLFVFSELSSLHRSWDRLLGTNLPSKHEMTL